MENYLFYTSFTRHKDVAIIIIFGMKYELLSEIFHEELAQAMHRNTGIEVEDAYKAIDTYLKQTRKDERTQNRVSILSIFPFFSTYFTLTV